MASRFENCIASLKAAGQISDPQAQEVLEAFKNWKAKGADDAVAGMEASAIMLWKKQQNRAQAAEQVLKAKEILDRAETHPEGFAVGVQSHLMADKYGWGGKEGFLAAADGIGAMRGAMHAKFVQGIDAYRSKAAGLTRDVPRLVNMVREIYAEGTGDSVAAAASKGFLSANDFGADMFIAAGGAMAKRERYFPNPKYQPAKIQAEGKEAFSKYLHDAYNDGRLRLRDWETLEPADPVQAATIIASAVETLHSGGLNKIVPGQAGSSKIANKRSDPRVLEWTSADAWLDANRRWGTGDSGIWDTIIGHFESLARDVGLMRALGPNPSGMTRMLADEVKKRGGSTWDVAVIQGAYDHLSGKLASPKHESIAFATRQLGALHAASKLLSSPISAIGDMVTLSTASLWNGLPVVKVLGDYLKAFGPGGHLTRKDAIAHGLAADFWINRAHAAARDMEAFGGSSFLERSADFLLRASFANVQANNARAVFQLNFLQDLGTQAGRGFDSLKGRTKRALTRVGISADDWDTIRTQGLFKEDGDVSIYPEQLLQSGATDQGLKLMGLISREQDFAQVQGDLRADMVKTLGTQSGTVVGMGVREFMRFKSYSIGIVTTHINRMMFEGDHSKAGRLGMILAFGTAMTVMGGLAMQLRMIANGRDPRDMTAPSFWGAAALQGGGLGIFGDLIKSGATRTGGSWWAAVGGPTAGLIEDAVKMTLGNAGEAIDGKNTNWGREAVRFLRNHTPGSNLWYARKAIDGYLWDYLQSVVDPDYRQSFQRTQDRARKEHNQEMWWPPGAFGPQRAPDLGAALGR